MTRPTLLSVARTLLFAAFSVLACTWAETTAFAQGGGHVGNLGHLSAPRVSAPHHLPPRPIHPFPPRPIQTFPAIAPIFAPPSFWLFGGLSFGFGLGFDLLGWQNCGLGLYWDWGCNPWPIYSPPPVYNSFPIYFYGGGEPSRVQLSLKDGTVYSVTDYWLADGQLHFTTVEEGGAKSVEDMIDFDELDLQKTVDMNTERDFRFVLRNKAIEQYLRERSETGAPGAPTMPSPQQPR